MCNKGEVRSIVVKKGNAKRAHSLMMRILIVSILLVLFFALAAPLGAAMQYTLEGWTLSPHAKWTTGMVDGWSEGDCVPFRFTVVNNEGSNKTINETLSFDYRRGNIYGIIQCENFVIPNGTIEGPIYETVQPAEGHYYWNFTIPAGDTYLLQWCARLSHECANYPGGSMHVRTVGGNKDVPIKNPSIVPDLYATKSANVTCNAITYTISYGNQGGQNQTNTVLVDDYDETKVTVTNAGGGTDNGSAITWAIGNLATGASGTKSYSVSLKPGVAGGTAIINNGTITGYFAELDTADNSYSVTSNAKVGPVANFTSNSPQIYCYNITFNDTSTGGTTPYTWYWDFNDGITSTDQNTSHRYSTPGTYDVTLTVTDANNCTNSTTKPVVASGYTAGLAITKKANVTSATVGTVIGYTINVTNTGNANLTSVLVTDSLTGLNETIPILAHGATQTFNTTHTVTESEICNPITNIATANGTDPCGVAVVPVTASVTVTHGYTAGLSVVKGANVTSATVGTVIGYTIDVTNTGTVNLTDVLVTDSLTGLNETLTLLAPGSSHIFNTTHTVTESDICGLIVNTATANGTDPCGYLTPTAIGVFSVRSGYTATLSITKEANVTSATIGTVIGYTINVSNAGNVNITSVLVTDNLTGLNETIPTLAPGATHTFNTTYTVTQSDHFRKLKDSAKPNLAEQIREYT